MLLSSHLNSFFLILEKPGTSNPVEDGEDIPDINVRKINLMLEFWI